MEKDIIKRNRLEFILIQRCVQKLNWHSCESLTHNCSDWGIPDVANIITKTRFIIIMLVDLYIKWTQTYNNCMAAVLPTYGEQHNVCRVTVHYHMCYVANEA